MGLSLGGLFKGGGGLAGSFGGRSLVGKGAGLGDASLSGLLAGLGGNSAGGGGGGGDPTGIDRIFSQLDTGLAGLEPFAQAGLGGLQGLQQSSTLEGLGGGLSDIFNSPAIQPLINDRMRSASSAFGSAGLTRSGGAIQAAADIPTELAFALEQLLGERRSELAGIGLGANSLGAELRNQASLGAGGLLADRFGTQTGADQQSKNRKQERLNSVLSTLGSVAGAAGAFSDARLKTNIKPIGTLNDLTIYEWDWVDGVPELLGDELMTTGFVAQEVAEKHPEFVHESHGFLTINYDGLLEKMEVVGNA